MADRTTPIIRSNGDQIDDNSADAIHSLLNEMLQLLQSTAGFQGKLSYLVCDTLANWHDLTTANLLRRVIDGELGKEFTFKPSEWFVKEMGKTSVTIGELTDFACQRVRRKNGIRLRDPEYLDPQQLRNALCAKRVPPSQASEATSEPALGAASSAPQG